MILTDRSPLLLGILAAIATIGSVNSLAIAGSLRSGLQRTQTQANLSQKFGQSSDQLDDFLGKSGDEVSPELSRRKMMTKTAALASFSFLPTAIGSPKKSSAAVGTLPEFADTNAIVNGLTINVADASQQEAMIDFLIGAFDFEVQRQRIQGTIEETVSENLYQWKRIETPECCLICCDLYFSSMPIRSGSGLGRSN